jgi:hypothetical protein
VLALFYKETTMKYLMVLLLSLVMSAPVFGNELVLKNPPPDQLQAFVSGVIGNQENAWWTINQEKVVEDRQALDITIHIGTGQARFVVILEDGMIINAQNVDLEAEVDCQHEGETARNEA